MLGDLNCEGIEEPMEAFCTTYNLKNLINEPTCFKNMDNPSCIDLILTNKNRSFTSTKVIETGLSDHHKMTVTVLKSYFKKSKPETISYRSYKNVNVKEFRKDLQKQFTVDELTLNCETSEHNFLDKHAPFKEKLIRGNESPFMNGGS